MEWISIQDQFPENGEDILCFGIIENSTEPKISIGRYVKEINGEKDRNEFWESEWGYDICEVTHWMPLPKSPCQTDQKKNSET